MTRPDGLTLVLAGCAFACLCTVTTVTPLIQIPGALLYFGACCLSKPRSVQS